MSKNRQTVQNSNARLFISQLQDTFTKLTVLSYLWDLTFTPIILSNKFICTGLPTKVEQPHLYLIRRVRVSFLSSYFNNHRLGGVWHTICLTQLYPSLTMTGQATVLFVHYLWLGSHCSQDTLWHGLSQCLSLFFFLLFPISQISLRPIYV